MLFLICPHGLISEVVVIDDGSTDETVLKVQEFKQKYPMGRKIKLSSHKENLGKGAALQTGFETTKQADIVLMLDADLKGLKNEHLDNLISPFIWDKKILMICGKFKGGRIWTSLAQKIAPSWTGQRALKRELIDKLPNLSEFRYGVDRFLTVSAKKITRDLNLNPRKVIRTVPLKGLTHAMQREKLGFWKGNLAYIKMYFEVFKTSLNLKRKKIK